MTREKPELDIPAYRQAMAGIPAALKQMGYTELREGQKQPLYSILQGKDTILIAPTSFGKTCVFALPSIIKKWKTIVFSPLIALMKDQVESMNRKGIRAACVNSSQADIENYQALRDWSEETLDMLYVAPERIGHPQFEMAMKAVTPSLLVADEAHCLSTWSASFRPSYCAIGEFMERYNPTVAFACTATATPQVIADIRRIMHMDNCELVVNNTQRTELHLSSSLVEHPSLIAGEVLKKVRSIDGSIIVYCQTVKQVLEIYEHLSNAGESVTLYHGQIPNPADKALNQEAFMTGAARICVATNAFGMGVDKADIRAIIHASPPSSVEAISQEIGRAARDGKDAWCHMFYTKQSFVVQQMLFENSNPTPSAVRKAYGVLSEYADSEGVARVTGEKLAEITEEKGIESACNVLETQGCVERFREPRKIYTFFETGLTPDVLKPVQKKLYDIVREFGSDGGTSDTGEPIYKMDLEDLAAKCKVVINTMKAKIADIAKTNVFRVIYPFNGKCTRLIHPPTADNLKNIEERYNLEWQKITDAREYLTTPDDKKHQFLSEYFAKVRKIVS